MGPSNTRRGDETRAELKSRACITEHTRYPGRLSSRNQWCLHPSSAPAQTLDSPLGLITRFLRGNSHILRGGPEPPLQSVQTAFARPRSYPPRPHRTQPLPRPCHLGRLTHGSPHRGGYLSSSRVPSPLGNQSLLGVRSPNPVSTFPTRRNQSSRNSFFVAPPSAEGLGSCLKRGLPVKPREAAAPNYWRGNHIEAMLVRGKVASGPF